MLMKMRIQLQVSSSMYVLWIANLTSFQLATTGCLTFLWNRYGSSILQAFVQVLTQHDKQVHFSASYLDHPYTQNYMVHWKHDRRERLTHKTQFPCLTRLHNSLILRILSIQYVKMIGEGLASLCTLLGIISLGKWCHNIYL